eukprot:scaffold43780_cov42-Phaeocystis_antarctica.AAC.2
MARMPRRRRARMRARTTARTTASKTANASEDLRGGALRAACGVQRSRGPRGRARGKQRNSFDCHRVGGLKCANFGATKHVYAWKFATALQGCAEFQASPRSAPSWNSSFLGPPPCEVPECEKRPQAENAPWPSSCTSLEALTA